MLYYIFNVLFTQLNVNPVEQITCFLYCIERMITTYQINDVIIYGAQGVCKIEEIIEKNICNNKIEYYVLKPIYDEKSTIFVPINNKALTAKMKQALTSNEVYEIIKDMPNEETIWIDNENVRKEKYREIISNGSRKELVQLIKTLYLYKQKQLNNGKRLHNVDDAFLKEAEKLLYDEFALVLNIKREDVLPFILEKINEVK